MNPEKHQPSEEDVSRAERMMTDDQRQKSFERQRDFEWDANAAMTNEQRNQSHKRESNVGSRRGKEWEGKREDLKKELEVERKKFVNVLLKNVEFDGDDDEQARLLEPHLSLLNEDELIRVAKSGSIPCQIVADYLEPEIAKLDVNGRVEFAKKYGGYWRMWHKVASVGGLSRMDMARIGDIADDQRKRTGG